MLVQDVQDPKGKRDERVRRGIFFKLLMDVVSPLAPPYRGERERGERERGAGGEPLRRRHRFLQLLKRFSAAQLRRLLKLLKSSVDAVGAAWPEITVHSPAGNRNSPPSTHPPTATTSPPALNSQIHLKDETSVENEMYSSISVAIGI